MDLEYVGECLELADGGSGLRWKLRPGDHFNTEVGAKIWNTRFAGKLAGTRSTHGWMVRLDGRAVVATKLVWLLGCGEWPEFVIHLDGDKFNNNLDNLCVKSRKEFYQDMVKTRPSNTGVVGVVRHVRDGNYHASIQRNGEYFRKTFGFFEDAVAWRKAMELRFK